MWLISFAGVSLFRLFVGCFWFDLMLIFVGLVLFVLGVFMWFAVALCCVLICFRLLVCGVECCLCTAVVLWITSRLFRSLVVCCLWVVCLFLLCLRLLCFLGLVYGLLIVIFVVGLFV